ncbi:MAG TPA: YceI family protein [Saprospiraceae bacterium]|nr:YceI family protein [Saprospiraceae bacterium]
MNKTVNWAFLQLLLVATGLYATSLSAQNIKSITACAGTMKLSGTSTMHDWDMNGTFHIDAKFKMAEGTNKLQSLTGLSFTLPVENLKSEKKKLNETAYKALKTDQHKEIHFKMNSATVSEVQPNRYKVVAQGNLTIAGVTKPITLEVLWVMNSDETITCVGVKKLKMTDFNVEPPSFLGFMKTGDDISLDFTFQFKS